MDADKCWQHYSNSLVPLPPHRLQPECPVLGLEGGHPPSAMPHRSGQDLMPCHQSEQWSIHIKDIPFVLDANECDLHSWSPQKCDSKAEFWPICSSAWSCSCSEPSASSFSVVPLSGWGPWRGGIIFPICSSLWLDGLSVHQRIQKHYRIWGNSESPKKIKCPKYHHQF